MRQKRTESARQRRITLRKSDQKQTVRRQTLLVICRVCTEFDSGGNLGAVRIMVIVVITMLMEICKAPTPRPKAQNKKNVTHSEHRDGECYPQFNKQLTHSVDNNKGSSISMYKMPPSHTHTRTHTHTHTVQIKVKDGVAELKYSEKSNVFSLLLKEERIAERPTVWGVIVPDAGTEVCENR